MGGMCESTRNGNDACIPTVIAARRQALLGIVDWKKLLEVTKTHPGYYSYALIKM